MAALGNRLAYFATLIGFLCGCSGAKAPFERDDRSRLPGGEATNTLLIGVNAFNQPVENLLDEHRTAFFSGNSLFNSAWVEAPSSTEARDGLGPLFNARNCSACHFEDGRGSLPTDGSEGLGGLLLRLRTGFDEQTGLPLPDPNYGGQLQPLALPDVTAEATVVVSWKASSFTYPDGSTVELRRPRFKLEDLAFGALSEDTVLSPRVAPAMIGLGLLDLVPAERLLELAQGSSAASPGISGRVRYLSQDPPLIGRFGWKAEQPSVRRQAAAAFVGDLGVTSSIFPDQDCTAAETECVDVPNGGDPEVEDTLLSSVEFYSRLLAVPERRDWEDETVIEGERIFSEVGCTNCHVPSHHTGSSDDLPELGDQLIWPYTDLLLHDMGEGLADEGDLDLDAEWRTPPLWGLGLIPEVNGHQQLLHDGRATGVEAAILWHAGEADSARQAFAARPLDDRKALIAFVNSL